jgi:hypothetical protein
MTSSTIRTLMFSGFLAILTAVPAAASIATSSSPDARPVKSTAMQYARAVCMTDEGQGRYKPCDSGYKKEHSDWRSSDNCMTDEGGGRFKPCDAGYKKKHMKH